MFGSDTFDRDVTYAEGVAAVAATPAEWEPGTAAAYHATSGWRILGAIVEAVDGRRIDQYVRDEVLAPLGVSDTSLGFSLDEQARLGDRLVPVAWKGHVLPKVDADGGLSMAPYRVDKKHNQPWHIAKVEPGGGMRGPGELARALLRVVAGVRAAPARSAHRGHDDGGAPIRNEGRCARSPDPVGPRRASGVHGWDDTTARSDTVAWRARARSRIRRADS